VVDWRGGEAWALRWPQLRYMLSTEPTLDKCRSTRSQVKQIYAVSQSGCMKQLGTRADTTKEGLQSP
jgi:hypothetical protein